MKRSEIQRGFTMIEILVVIAIIGFFGGIVLFVATGAKTKSGDSKRVADLDEIRTALYQYHDMYGKMPDNHNCYDFGTHIHTICPVGNQAACDAPLPGVPGGTDSMLDPDAYNASMQDLVDAKLLENIPHSSPDGPGYCYADTGIGSDEGAMLVTELIADQPSLTGRSNTCRPYTGGTWCTSDTASNQYCLCNPY